MNNGKDKTILLTHKIGGRISVDIVDLINTIHADPDGWFDRLIEIIEESYPDDSIIQEA